MENNILFQRKGKEDLPIVAICYDFDHTLSPDDMQAQGFLQKNYDGTVEDFWKDVNDLSNNNTMDQNLAWMHLMIKYATGKEWLTKDKLREYGSNIKLFDGVDTWFSRINKLANDIGVKVEHYIISSGLKEMIEGTSISEYFTEIYASSYYYNEDNIPVWPAQVINYTGKTQYLFRKEKGVLDPNDQDVNTYFAEEEIRIPFSNFIYIGDSDTDIPCMKLVMSKGGHSIGVYDLDSADQNSKDKVDKMIREKRINYRVAAKFSAESELENLVINIMKKIKYSCRLKNIEYQNRNEVIYFMQDCSELDAERKKKDLLLDLRDSDSFKRSHTIISYLSEFEDWSKEDKAFLKKIREDNFQVSFIRDDDDVKKFYDSLGL